MSLNAFLPFLNMACVYWNWKTYVEAELNIMEFFFYLKQETYSLRPMIWVLIAYYMYIFLILQDNIFYSIVSGSARALSFFRVDRYTGAIYLKQPLTSTTVQTFDVSQHFLLENVSFLNNNIVELILLIWHSEMCLKLTYLPRHIISMRPVQLKNGG